MGGSEVTGDEEGDGGEELGLWRWWGIRVCEANWSVVVEKTTRNEKRTPHHDCGSGFQIKSLFVTVTRSTLGSGLSRIEYNVE